MSPRRNAGPNEIDLRRGVLNPVGDARVGVMIVDEGRIRLGVVEPDGSEHVDWYAEGAELTAGGMTWRVAGIQRGDARTQQGPVARLTAKRA